MIGVIGIAPPPRVSPCTSQVDVLGFVRGHSWVALGPRMSKAGQALVCERCGVNAWAL